MRKFMRFFHDKFYIEMGIASILFAIALLMDKVMDFIIYMLYFIIFLEIVRAVLNYIREQKVVLALLVDAFIILALREFIVNVVKINTEEINSIDALISNSYNYNILIISAVIIFLFLVRYLSVKTAHNLANESSKNIKK